MRIRVRPCCSAIPGSACYECSTLFYQKQSVLGLMRLISWHSHCKDTFCTMLYARLLMCCLVTHNADMYPQVKARASHTIRIRFDIYDVETRGQTVLLGPGTLDAKCKSKLSSLYSGFTEENMNTANRKLESLLRFHRGEYEHSQSKIARNSMP